MTSATSQAEPEWLRIARAELGVKEPSPRVLEYIASVHGEPGDDWCSAAMNWVFQQAGIKGTGSRAARSWQKWGVKLDEPRLGCVAVLWRESKKSWKGHVALWVGNVGPNVALVGGNQDRAFKTKLYPADRVLTFRWPSGIQGQG